MNNEEICFFSEDNRIAATLYRPGVQAGRVPAVVVCCGFGGLQDSQPPRICSFLASQGYLALSFDYAGFGKSDGPKGRVDPWMQVMDTRNAITYLQTLEEVRADSIGVYGTSFGGGNAVYVAAVDERVKCTVATVPVANGERWLMSLRPYWQWLELLKRVEKARIHRVVTGEREFMDRFELMTLDPDSRKYYERRAADVGDRGLPLALESVEFVRSFKPEDYVHRIGPRPLLLIHSEDDKLVSHRESLALYARAVEPKRLEIISGAGHYDVYDGETFQRIMDWTAEWFGKYL